VRPESHEKKDAEVSKIFLVGGLLLVVIVMVLLLMSLMVPQAPSPPVPTAHGTPFAGGQGPALQIDPEQDLAMLRAEEKGRLESYSWVDRERGIVAIPIERAMELMVERGDVTRGENR
jgi:hypothetical protein